MAVKEKVTLDKVVDLLNQALELDPEAINELFSTRVVCKDGLADHPTIQVFTDKERGFSRVGLIGIINGIFGIDNEGWGHFGVKLDSNDKIEEFLKFEREDIEKFLKEGE